MTWARGELFVSFAGSLFDGYRRMFLGDDGCFMDFFLMQFLMIRFW
jgi:hypothetical protein